MFADEIRQPNPKFNQYENYPIEDLQKMLVTIFGYGYCGRLARLLEVHEATVYRMFAKGDIKRVYRLAIARVIQEHVKKINAM